MRRLNCWEFMQCGRERRGAKAAELGVCPAFLEKSADGINGGINAGRICWAIAGTLCNGEIQGTFAKDSLCLNCPFYYKVKSEEEFIRTKL